jgi:hypothetical protein
MGHVYTGVQGTAISSVSPKSENVYAKIANQPCTHTTLWHLEPVLFSELPPVLLPATGVSSLQSQEAWAGSRPRH